jgi:hypothetical protein
MNCEKVKDLPTNTLKCKGCLAKVEIHDPKRVKTRSKTI